MHFVWQESLILLWEKEGKKIALERRKEKGERRKEKGERRKEKGERRKEKGGEEEGRKRKGIGK